MSSVSSTTVEFMIRAGRQSISTFTIPSSLLPLVITEFRKVVERVRQANRSNHIVSAVAASVNAREFAQLLNEVNPPSDDETDYVQEAHTNDKNSNIVVPKVQMAEMTTVTQDSPNAVNAAAAGDPKSNTATRKAEEALATQFPDQHREFVNKPFAGSVYESNTTKMIEYWNDFSDSNDGFERAGKTYYKCKKIDITTSNDFIKEYSVLWTHYCHFRMNRIKILHYPPMDTSNVF